MSEDLAADGMQRLSDLEEARRQLTFHDMVGPSGARGAIHAQDGAAHVVVEVLSHARDQFRRHAERRGELVAVESNDLGDRPLTFVRRLPAAATRLFDPDRSAALLVDEVLGFTGAFAYLAGTSFTTAAVECITWAELLLAPDRSGAPRFIADWCDQEIQASARAVPDPSEPSVS
jgi:hypothetical protein